VRAVVYPYPRNEDISAWEGTQVLNVPHVARKHVWFTNVGENLGGLNNTVCVVTARGIDVREARRRAYRTLTNIVTSKEVIYRNDIGAGVDARLNQLREWGWINKIV